MELQHQQLQQLTDWLDVTEARIKRMGAQPLGPDLEDVKHQVEEHKVGSCWSNMFSEHHLSCSGQQSLVSHVWQDPDVHGQLL